MRKIRRGAKKPPKRAKTSLLDGRKRDGTSQRCSEGTVGLEEEFEAGATRRGDCPRDQGPSKSEVGRTKGLSSFSTIALAQC